MVVERLRLKLNLVASRDVALPLLLLVHFDEHELQPLFTLFGHTLRYVLNTGAPNLLGHALRKVFNDF